ncbi:MAG: aminotransferase class I/II-fold pyridoxal phosphate-dependent enzyme [Clostridia bacterium]|nr:aminotransferase class I/II-fold pyridoxal phosphate-dependent enzyme [Clostridia bacterium]
MSRELYDKIKEYNDNVKARFCMPSHNGQASLGGLYSSAQFDWTEVQGLDNLLHSEDVIALCEKKLARRYGYQNALMLTSGSTCGMQIAMALAKLRNGVAIAIGDMHKSFYSSSRILGTKIRCCKDIADAQKLSGQERISCIFVTSPNYFGKAFSLKEIKEFALRAGALLIVDEAHSAHFPYSSLLPDNASKFADISLVSMHKALPVYGGGAILLTNGEEVYQECRLLRADIHSTSPNYLVMASMDFADDYMKNHGEEEYAKVKRQIEEFKRELKVGKVVDTDDFTRLVVKIDGADCNKASDRLVTQGIFAEMAYGDLLVFIVTPFNCDKLNLLADALGKIPLEKLESEIEVDFGMLNEPKDGELILVNVEDALDKTCAVEVGIYPPGVPIIKKGDVINQKAVDFIKKYSSRLFGLASGRIAVLK